MAEILRKSRFVNHFNEMEPQTEVSGLFRLGSLSVRQGTRSRYLALTLVDRTGEVDGRVWDNFEEMASACSEGCYVKVKGRVDRYQGKTQLLLTYMKPVEASEVFAADFVPASQFDAGEMEAELRGYVAAIGEPHLRMLVLSFLDDPAIGPAFLEAPAAKKLHHAWLHGLLEHVVFLLRIIRAVAPFYPEANLDLVVTGAILHDIGKVRELSWDGGFRYTLEGQLVGHISIVQRLLADRVSALDAAARADAAKTGGVPDLFPEPLRLLLEHLLLAHHGKLEFGSPKLPMTPEALLFSTLDDLEAKFQTMRMEFAAAEAAKRSPLEPTEWVRSMERALFDSQRYLKATMVAAPVTPPEAPAQTSSLFDSISGAEDMSPQAIAEESA